MKVGELLPKEIIELYSLEILQRLVDSDKADEAYEFAKEKGLEAIFEEDRRRTTPVEICEYLKGFSAFDEFTALGKLREELYHQGRSIEVSRHNTKDKEEIIYYEYKKGNLYERKEIVDLSKEEESTQIKLMSSLELIIKNAFHEGNSVYLVYKMPFKDEATEEFDIAIEKISNIARLNTSQSHFLWRLLIGISSEFLKLDSRIYTDNGVYVSDKIKVIAKDLPEKPVLENLIKLYNLTDKGMRNILSNTFLYSMFIPLNEPFRARDYIVPALLIYGRGGDGKSAIVRLCTVKGYGNRFLDKTEQDVATVASMRENFSKTNLPLLIDEISEKAMEKHIGYLKSALTGMGSASRGRITGGNKEWKTRTIPIYTSNEAINIDSGANRRLFKMQSKSIEPKRISNWKDVYNELPDGFMYIFLKRLDGKAVADIVKETVSGVNTDDELSYAYMKYMQNIADSVFKEYGLENPFRVSNIREEDESDIYNAFIDYFASAYDMYPNITKARAGADYAVEDAQDGRHYYITAKGYGYFRKDFPAAPVYTTTFVNNAPKMDDVVFEYITKKVLGHTQRVIHMLIKSLERSVFPDENLTKYVKNIE